RSWGDHPPTIPIALPFIPEAPPCDGYRSPVHADRPTAHGGRTHPRSPSPFRSSRRHYPATGTGPPFMPTALPLMGGAPTLDPHRPSVHPGGTTQRRV